MNESFDAIVIGAGPSGLAAGYHLKQAGLRHAILEARPAPTGSWPDYYDSLTLFSPARYAALPGLSWKGDLERYPTRNDVIEYLARYAAHFALPVRLNTHVKRVQHADGMFNLETSAGDFCARSVIVASGGFNQPNLPHVPGLDAFGGRVLHSSTYKNTLGFEGRRILVVGSGNSAIQIAAELADVAHVTLASREPLRLKPQRILGRDVHFWLRVTGVDYILPPPSRRFSPPLDAGKYQAMLKSGKIATSPMFSACTETGVRWADGREQPADVVLFATGFTQQPGFLDGLGPIQQRAGIAQNVPGLYFVGLPYQRNFASATLRGAGPDAAHVVRTLAHRLRSNRRLRSHRPLRGNAPANGRRLSQILRDFCARWCTRAPAA